MEKGDDMKPTISIKGEDETPSKQSKAESTSEDDNGSVDAFGRAKDEISDKGSTDELEQQVGKVDGESGKSSKIASKSETGADDAAIYEAKVKDVSKSEQEKESTDELKQVMQSEETIDVDSEEDAKAAAQAKLGNPSNSVVRDDAGTVVGEASLWSHCVLCFVLGCLLYLAFFLWLQGPYLTFPLKFLFLHTIRSYRTSLPTRIPKLAFSMYRRIVLPTLLKWIRLVQIKTKIT